MKLKNFSLTALAAFGLLAGGTQAFARDRAEQPYGQSYNQRQARSDYRSDYRESRFDRERRERREHEEWLRRQRFEHSYGRESERGRY